jgi:maleate isomerase
VILPPWFDEAFALRSRTYLKERQFDAVGHLIHKPEPKWRALRHDELYRAFMHIEQRTDILFDQIVTACPSSADAVLIAGTGFRCVGIINSLEKVLARPVITANQASLWRCLAHLGFSHEVQGYGRLFGVDK